MQPWLPSAPYSIYVLIAQQFVIVAWPATREARKHLIYISLHNHIAPGITTAHTMEYREHIYCIIYAIYIYICLIRFLQVYTRKRSSSGLCLIYLAPKFPVPLILGKNPQQQQPHISRHDWVQSIVNNQLKYAYAVGGYFHRQLGQKRYKFINGWLALLAKMLFFKTVSIKGTMT